MTIINDIVQAETYEDVKALLIKELQPFVGRLHEKGVKEEMKAVMLAFIEKQPLWFTNIAYCPHCNQRNDYNKNPS